MASPRRGASFFALALALAGCGDDDSTLPGQLTCADPGGDPTSNGCAVALEASGGDDVQAVQTALIEATSGSTVCFCPGYYSFTKELSLSVPNVTVRGLGPDVDSVILDFADQAIGDDGITVSADGFTIENLSVRNTPGNGIVVTGVEDVTFRDLLVSWDAGSVTENGAYAVYPVESTRVIVENSEIVGAADAGIYVGQCKNAIVRNNDVHGNVAGIEIENTLDAEVYGNDSYDNTAGILVFTLPKLTQKDGARTLVHDNQVHENNRPNFGDPGTTVGLVPEGLGMLVLANDYVEIRDNTIENNDTTSVMVVSYPIIPFLGGSPSDDPETDQYSTHICVHDNGFSGNGQSPNSDVATAIGPMLEDVLWDGQVDPAAMTPPDDVLCLGTDPPLPSFRNFMAPMGLGNPMLHSTDTTPHECTCDPLDSQSF
jgi:parallel beta-helix repeat protein